MSKKSRKRNKKILAALALAGGAAMLGRGKGAVTGVVNPNLQKTIAADAGADIATDVVAPDTTSRFQTRFTKDGRGPNEIRMARALTAGNQVPPSMRGGALHAEGYTPRTRGPNRFGTLYKGGGIAKRGTGAAYKSGGRVKSMGIAKRGGGAAKR